ncbi:hypothetical protein [Kaistia terrae]|uniref:Uncharacterized protein n=1 Tax=Kaistia terrae TaxID=537017 RepID=A0ABW0Q4W9_9HYPH|nr:hypothetical protein [Kaistia terrae]MCX5581454.1 hypothetical protein [Kaistia terrae]
MSDPCNCIEAVDEKLKERNTQLSKALVFSQPAGERLMIATEVVEKKRGARATVMFPSFCPFCGIKYAA